MESGLRVLVVDGLSETETVLRAVLEPRGLQVDRIRSTQSPTTTGNAPSVVVIHLDESPPENQPPIGWQGVPQIFIGSATTEELDSSPGPNQYFQKPFQYRELICAIEQLILKRSA